MIKKLIKWNFASECEVLTNLSMASHEDKYRVYIEKLHENAIAYIHTYFARADDIYITFNYFLQTRNEIPIFSQI